ncbi:hypothetical protein E2553_35205 [Paraburkholderia dipogonis]|uniref:Uncharacterized protein n=1 Tax=Paraburkholderia dipogonis TaxID=1211383 RepID=A0A4Y8MWV1_9BURK|nr:hypothetical protein [Paraburkholderia dipogonis]TFE41889.1 hypothetical protein E2553_35205 [Paraburkholderia dipogonis]
MNFISIRVLAGITVVSALSGCTAINFANMLEPVPKVAGSCKAQENTVLSLMLPGDGNHWVLDASKPFAYILPPAAVASVNGTSIQSLTPTVTSPGYRRTQPAKPVTTFEAFKAQIETASDQRVPEAVRTTSVFNAFRSNMIKSLAEAQTDMGVHAGLRMADTEAAKVHNYSPDSTVSLGDAKEFVKILAETQLRPTIQNPQVSGAGGSDNIFAEYFSTYYSGKFVDRFGQTIAKPSLKLPNLTDPTKSIDLSLTVSDADIASALTVLVEYLADLLDSTPVLGSSDPDKVTTSGPNATTFYPGGTASIPTAYALKTADYKKVSNDCGVTADNAKILGFIAKAAGDEAQMVNGLVAQSAGGIGVSLGVFGKISIGDNQTLGTLIKTFASRAAMRISFASTYLILERIGGDGKIQQTTYPLGLDQTQVIGGPGGANGYLKFSN